MKKERRKLFSAFDVLIILIVIAVSVLSFLSQFNKSDTNISCVIRHNGETIQTVSLDNIDDVYEYTVDGDYPVTVVIDSGSVFVKNSTCPDKLCEHTGKISHSGRSIVCLPAKVSVTLESVDSEIDAVVG